MVGQTETLARLERAALNPVHAYLFLGRRGSGTFRAALGFAALVLANAVEAGADGQADKPSAADEQSAVDDTSVARERASRLALEGKHPDLMLFEPQGSALRVSEAEAIIKAGLRTPVEGRRKVIVVSGADAIEEAAIGKLLKVVEEPPPSTVFVLLADEVPPEIVTIASRCVPVEFGPLSAVELEQALMADGVPAERAAMAATAAAGDLDRARLLATDDALADRAATWQSVPVQLDGTGSTVCQLVDRVREGMDAAQGPLEVRHGEEMEQLEARVEQLGERGSGRAELVARHKREIRRLRTDELLFGLAVLSRVYRDRLLDGHDSAAEEALAALQTAAENLIRNPNEALLLQDLFLRLSPPPNR
jgi:DNA polymerase-3 subunit delta'